MICGLLQHIQAGAAGNAQSDSQHFALIGFIAEIRCKSHETYVDRN
jgi:hypothetical protein